MLYMQTMFKCVDLIVDYKSRVNTLSNAFNRFKIMTYRQKLFEN